jgi:hypothetical protein
MIKVKVVTKTIGTKPKKRLDYFESFTLPFSQEQLIEVADMVKDEMRSVINTMKRNKTTSTDSLESKIDSEILNRTAENIMIGIGRIALLPAYWRAVNDGFTPPTTGKKVPMGSFQGNAPDSNMSGGIWNIPGNFMFTDTTFPHQYVKPFNYIEIADQLGNSIMRDINRRIASMIQKELI